MPRRLDGRLLFGCGPCRPKWVKVVDNIYTGNHSVMYHLQIMLMNFKEGIDKNVNITMEAISALVNTCYRLKLNLFDSSFLKMVLLLLEQDLPELQLLGTKSFLGFSQIEEDAPSYYREYDDLVDHFTRMAYSELPNEAERKKVRLAGIKGLQGVVRKTARGQLRMNALQSMEKIIPALLFNIHEKPPNDNEADESEPGCQAVFVFKDVVCRASFTNLIPVVSAMITHFDNHRLWTPSDFPLLVFGYLLDSIKNMQVAHNLVKELINYLRKSDTRLTTLQRISVVMVIDKSVITLAKGAIGPDVFHNFKALLQILRSSIEKTSKGVGADEQRFHDAIMNTIAEFAKNLPDAQKIEILKFILNFDPLPSGRSNSKDYSKPMVKVLVKTMLTVATQYQTVAISNAIDSDFLRLLLHGVALDPDASIRVYVQKILHALIDRHNNAPKLLKVRIYPPEEVTNVYTREKPSRQDILFMKKTGYLLTENTFHQMLDPSNKVDNLEHLMCTIGLVALEMGAEEVLVELLRLVLAVQQKTTESDGSLPLPHLCAIHAVLATVMSIIVPISSLRESLQSHVQGVIKTRRERAPYLLPDVAFNRKNTQETYPAQLVISEDMLFCREAVHSALQQAALDPSSLDVPYQPFDPLKALQSLRVAMLGSSAALAAAGGGGTGSVTTPGGRTSGSSEYDSTNRFSGWGTLPGSLNRGAGPGDTFRNGAQYGSRNAAPMGADSQSLSSLSMAESSQSILNAGSRASDLEKEEMISFKHAQKILYESPETRRKRKYAENMRMTSNYDTLMGKGTMDFNELCALHKERAQTRRFNMAGVFNDLSNELNRRKLSQRRTSLNTGGLSFLRGSNARNEKTDGVEMALRRSAAGSGGAAEENSGGEASEWAVDREGAAIVRETQEAKAEDTMGQGVAPSAVQSNWDSNFISLFVS
ncbi:Protein EFR3 -like protein B [Echinococcus granulosus]|nr:Protein EFR3 -like protein B [Echinococcus granulosus]